MEKKEKAIAMVQEDKISPKQVAHFLKIPVKNILRWLGFGVERKKGCGRKKHDPIMEEQLLIWVKQEKDLGYQVS